MGLARLGAVASDALLTVALAACGSSEKTADKQPSSTDNKGALIGVTMPTKVSERWIKDGDSVKS